MPVADAMFRVCLADSDQAVDPQAVTEQLYGLGDPFTDADPMLERTDDLVRILLL